MSIFGGAFGKDGGWWMRSEKDPRFNKRGRAFVSGMCGPVDFDLKDLIKGLEKLYGKKPSDLKVGWMKD